MSTSIDEMSRLLGGLEMAVRNLTTLWQRQDEQANDGRRILHVKIEALTHQVQALSARVDVMTRELGEMRPSVDDWEAVKQRGIGARLALKTLWGAAIGMGGASFYALLEYFHILPPRH